MSLGTIARRVIPASIRRSAGIAALGLAARNTTALRGYVRLLHGYGAGELAVDRGSVTYRYRDHLIRSPRDGAGSFLEVFKDEVYDRVFTPLLGDAVIDVGAYVGMWSVRAALAVGREGRVVAVEPDVINLRYLELNTRGFVQSEWVPWVASDHDGVEEMFTSDTSSCHSLVIGRGKKIPRRCRTIDTIAREQELDRVDLIKIDAEGAELKVLHGAINTLHSNPRIRLSIACYRDLPDGVPGADAVVAFLRGNGFRVQTAEGLRRYIYADLAS